jgi:very-short-patch-repair endonuclease
MSRGGLFRKQIGDSSEEKYGSRTPFQSSKILNQIKQTLERKYGVSNAYQIKEIKQKAINSLLNNWGAPTFMQSARFKQLIKTHAIQIKRHETMKRNASYGKSRLEDQFYELLCCSFGECNVVRQVAVNHRAIDFYVKSNDCYIQFDGKYWHGLSECYRADKDEPKTHREQYMKYIYEIDRCQDEWFKANNMCLIRVTDVEFKTMGTNVLTKIGLQK